MTENFSQSLSKKYQVFADIPRPEREALNGFSEVGVSDVLEGLGLDSLLDAGIKPVWHGAQIIGPAVTVLNAPGDTLMMHYALELSRAGDVLVITCEEENPSATWGKMVTVAAMGRGIAGAVVDGSVRDSAYIREAKFPVWTRSYSPRGSRRKGPGSINVPVICGGVLVNPGDLIMADDDGIIVFPQQKISSALAAAKARAQREESIMPKLEQGITPYILLGMEEAIRQAGLQAQPGCYKDQYSSVEIKNDR